MAKSAAHDEEREKQQNTGQKLQETEREMRMDAEAEPAPEKIYGINSPQFDLTPLTDQKVLDCF